eukprot:2358605-Prymnesium_polylepis.1
MPPPRCCVSPRLAFRLSLRVLRRCRLPTRCSGCSYSNALALRLHCCTSAAVAFALTFASPFSFGTFSRGLR